MNARRRDLAWLLMPAITIALVVQPMLNAEMFWWGDAVNQLWLLAGAQDGGRPLWFLQRLAEQPALIPWYLYYGGAPLSILSDLIALIGASPLAALRWLHVVALVVSTYAVALVVLRFKGPLWSAALISSIWATVPAHLVLMKGSAMPAYLAVSALTLLLLLLTVLPRAGPRLLVVVLTLLAVVGWLLLTLHTLTALLAMTVAGILAVAGLMAALPFGLLRPRSGGVAAGCSAPLRWDSLPRWCWGGLCAAVAAVTWAAPQTLPALLTARDTQEAARSYPEGDAAALSSLNVMFDPRGWLEVSDALGSRTVGLLLIWSLIGCVLMWRSMGARRRTAAIALVAGVVATVLVAGVPAVWPWLPFWLQAMQFPSRMVIHATLLIVILAAIVAGSVLINSRGPVSRAVMSAALIVCAVLSIPMGLHVNSSVGSTQRVPASAPEIVGLIASAYPPTWYAGWQQLAPAGSINPEDVASGDFGIRRFTATKVDGRLLCDGAGATQVSVATAPPLVRVIGLPVLGSTTEGLLVLDTRDCSSGEYRDVRIEQVTDAGWPRVAAAAAPWLGLGWLVAGVLIALWRRPRCERQSSLAPPSG